MISAFALVSYILQRNNKKANMSKFPSLYIKTRVVTFCVVTFRAKEAVTFCVKKMLQFALKNCYTLRQKLLQFGLILHFASVVTLRSNYVLDPFILVNDRIAKV